MTTTDKEHDPRLTGLMLAVAGSILYAGALIAKKDPADRQPAESLESWAIRKAIRILQEMIP